MVFVPLIVEYQRVKSLALKQQLLTIMDMLKTQYLQWTSNRHLPWLSSRPIPVVSPNPYSGFITNVGVVEDTLFRLWPQMTSYAGTPSFRIHDMILGHRVANFMRP